MRARLALLVSGQTVELREVALRDKPADMLMASPKGTVPVLVAPDGMVIDESIDIMRWALSIHDPERWLAGEDEHLLATNDGPFKHHLDRYKYPGRYASDAAEHRTAACDLLLPLEQRLQRSEWLCGARRTISDMALFPFVRQFAATDSAWWRAQPLPQLQRWLERNVTDPLFAAAMVRLPPWQPGDAPVTFGGYSAFS